MHLLLFILFLLPHLNWRSSTTTSNNHSANNVSNINNHSSSALSPLRTNIPRPNYISDLNSPLIQVWMRCSYHSSISTVLWLFIGQFTFFMWLINKCILVQTGGWWQQSIEIAFRREPICSGGDCRQNSRPEAIGKFCSVFLSFSLSLSWFGDLEKMKW